MITVTDLDKQAPYIFAANGVQASDMVNALEATHAVKAAGCSDTAAVRLIAQCAATGRVHEDTLYDLDAAGTAVSSRIASNRGETLERVYLAAVGGDLPASDLIDALAR